VSHRPLVFLSGLTIGDLLLWNWSLNTNHDVLALVSGLTLPPLAVASLWLLALSLARLIGYIARLPSARSRRARGKLWGSTASHSRTTAAAADAQETPSSPAGGAPSRKIAA
jgi:hypothetical protein